MFLQDAGEGKCVFNVLYHGSICDPFLNRLLTGRKISTESDAFEVSAALLIVPYLDLAVQ